MNVGKSNALNDMEGSPLYVQSEIDPNAKSAEKTKMDAANLAPSMEGKDTINTSGSFFTPVQFVSNTVHDFIAQTPALTPPKEDQYNSQPFGITEQHIVADYFSKEVKTLISGHELTPAESEEMYVAIMSGTEIANPDLARIAKKIREQANAKTREKANLPSSWTMESKSPKDWTPLPLKPLSEKEQEETNQYYHTEVNKLVEQHLKTTTPPLTPEETTLLKEAIETGKVSSKIASIYIEMTNQATKATQEAFGLPNSWVIGTTSIEDWKPIGRSIVNPSTILKAQKEVILSNIDQLMTGIEKAAKKAIDSLPVDEPTKLSIMSFLNAMQKTLSKLKEQLREVQLLDSEKASQTTKVKFDQLEDRKIRAKEMMETTDKMKAKQKKQKRISLVFKIVGPIIAAVSTIVGGLLAAFTFGASTAIIVAGLAVGAAMTAYSVVDSFTGVTGKIIKAVNEYIEELVPESSDTKKAAIKWLMVASVVAVVAIVAAVAIVLTGGGAAANIATQTVAATLKEAINLTIKQLTVYIILTLVMSSGAITDTLTAICNRLGLDKKESMIAQAVVMIVIMLVTVVAMTITRGGSKLPSADDFKNFTKQITSMLTNLKGLKDVPGIFTNKQLFMRALPSFLQMGSTGLGIASGIQSGVYALGMRKFLLELGDRKSAEEILQQLIKEIDKLIQNIQGGIESTGEQASSLATFINQFIDSIGQSSSNIIKAAHVPM